MALGSYLGSSLESLLHETGDMAKVEKIREYKLSQIPHSNKIHPGVILKKELETRGISIYRASDCLGISVLRLESLLNCNEDIDEYLARNISCMLGSSAEMWLTMQRNWHAGDGEEDAEGTI